MFYYLVIVVELLVLFFTSKYLIQSLYLIFLRIFKKTHAAGMGVFFIFFPGVIIHELAHLLMAEALFVRTGDFEVAPKIEGNGLKMGSVQVAQTDIVRRTLIGVAPILVGTAVLLIMLFAFLSFVNFQNIFSSSLNILITVIVIWATFLIVNTMFSSKKDLEGVVEFGLALIFLLFIIALTLFLLKIDFIHAVLNFFESQVMVEGVSRIAMLLLIPVGINLFVFLLSRFVVKKIY